MYRVRCSIKYQLGGICTAKLNLLSKQQRSILVLRLLGQTELVSSGNRCLISSTELHTRVFLPTHHHGISSIGRFTYTESSSSCFSQSGGDKYPLYCISYCLLKGRKCSPRHQNALQYY